MKNFVLLFFLGITVTSCVSNDEGTQFFLSTIDNVTMPSAYKVDSISQIMIQYKRPTDCYIFDGFYYAADGLTRDVAIKFAKVDQSNCQSDDTTYEIPLNFKPTTPGTYHFKFWTDRDVNGIDTYIEEDAVVPQ